ncbi:MAG: threonine synthase [Lachnospiraceae bacterium]|nr:threonine synthase [Lachnospiraceae bacterium]
MEVLYKSTRGDGTLITGSQAVLKGLADDGGLYVPNQIPKLDIELEKLADMNYREIAYAVISKFLTDYTEEELKDCIDHAYDSKFDDEEVAPVKKVGDVHFLELFHGSTIAFKDMALSILPYLLTKAAKKNNLENEIVILTATSGDTGKAALAGFANVPGTKIIVFYPKGGVSKIQELQMVTQKGDNTFVVGVNGNFDDAQTGVKKMFNDTALKAFLDQANYQFSSANSINVGRLVPQVAYYVWAYSRLVKDGTIKAGEKINFVVPTGNFGNILAGYYSKLMGLPVNKLICASNDNKVLFDFFKTGNYNRKREFILTSSPSMDILISSNLERLIYHITGEKEEENIQFMNQLTKDGEYTITEEEKALLEDFFGGYADEKENAACIKKTYEDWAYVTDTHTGVANCVYRKYLEETGDATPSVIVSTASPYKFARSVMTAIDAKYDSKDDFELIADLNQLSKVAIPKAIQEIMDAEIVHDHISDIDKMEDAVKGFLNI